MQGCEVRGIPGSGGWGGHHAARLTTTPNRDINPAHSPSFIANVTRKSGKVPKEETKFMRSFRQAEQDPVATSQTCNTCNVNKVTIQRQTAPKIQWNIETFPPGARIRLSDRFGTITQK